MKRSREEILTMEAGDELNAAVAKIMNDDLEHQWEEGPSRTGVKYCSRCNACDWMPAAERPCSVKLYSEDISVAWQIWQKMTDKEPFSWAIYSDCEGIVFVEHYPNDYPGAMKAGCGDFRTWGLCPEAICKAALLAKLESL